MLIIQLLKLPRCARFSCTRSHILAFSKFLQRLQFYRVCCQGQLFREICSCEPYRTKAYEEEMRWRIVWQTEGLGYTQSQAAKNLCIDKSTVSRIVTCFKATGSVGKKPYPKEKASRKLTVPAQDFISNLVLEMPGIYLRELQRELLDKLMVEVGTSAICKFLHQSNFRHQKLSITALQRDQFLRQKYIYDVAAYKVSQTEVYL